MSKTYTELYNIWLAFDAAEHFATKVKIAKEIASVEYLDEEVRAVNESLRKMISDGEHLFQEEYSAFVVKSWDYTFTWNGSFNLFFVDEDGLPIEMAMNLTQDQVFDTFKGMIVRTSANDTTCVKNADGILYHVIPPVFFEASEATTLAAYDLLVMKYNLMKEASNIPWVIKHRELEKELYKFLTE